MHLRTLAYILILAIVIVAFTAVYKQREAKRLGDIASAEAPLLMPNEPGYWKVYAKPTDAILREHLTPLQYEVTQDEGTEAAFHNAYWDNEDAGIYVDIVSGEPLFSSLDKYDSGTGWPSFTKPLVPENIAMRTDSALGFTRTEVRSRYGDSHLGHLFDDGPAPTGMRYCMNSASLRFVPVSELEASGYGEYAALFE